MQGEEESQKQRDAAALKEEGNALFQKRDFLGALSKYNHAFQLDPSNSAILSNRSASHAEMERWEEAATDAMAVIHLQPHWPKGYYRLAAARFGAASCAPMAGRKRSAPDAGIAVKQLDHGTGEQLAEAWLAFRFALFLDTLKEGVGGGGGGNGAGARLYTDMMSAVEHGCIPDPPPLFLSLQSHVHTLSLSHTHTLSHSTAPCRRRRQIRGQTCSRHIRQPGGGRAGRRLWRSAG